MRCSTLAVALFTWLSVPCPPPAHAQGATLWAVGDGGVSGPEDDRVAAYIERRGPFDRLLYLGDVYETGTREEFMRHYHPSFGRFKSITSPTPGNHEWGNHRTGYDPYWGELAPRTDGGHWYSFDLAGWHFVSLNSEEDHGPRSRQVAWLRSDLARREGTCTIAFWHEPRYNANPDRGNAPSIEPLWRALEGHASLVLNGHDHNYQRFPRYRRIVQLIVGTGGRSLYDLNERDPRLVDFTDEDFGALRIELDGTRAGFEFFTDTGRRLDSGSLTCSTAAAPAVEIRTPRSRVYSRRLRTFRGSARNTSGPVRLTLVRRTPTRRTRQLVAEGVESWSHTLGGRLRRGSYRLVARAEGARDQVRFTVR